VRCSHCSRSLGGEDVYPCAALPTAPSRAAPIGNRAASTHGGSGNCGGAMPCSQPTTPACGRSRPVVRCGTRLRSRMNRGRCSACYTALSQCFTLRHFSTPHGLASSTKLTVTLTSAAGGRCTRLSRPHASPGRDRANQSGRHGWGSESCETFRAISDSNHGKCNSHSPFCIIHFPHRRGEKGLSPLTPFIRSTPP
jgi:hypothetical protein